MVGERSERQDRLRKRPPKSRRSHSTAVWAPVRWVQALVSACECARLLPVTKPIKWGLTAVVTAAGLLALAYSSSGQAQYYMMVDEVMASPDVWVGKSMQIHGFVQNGSVKETFAPGSQKLERTFVIENQGKQVFVYHEGPTPDTFRDGSELVARGTFTQSEGQYTLRAETLMAKCPSKYEGASANSNVFNKSAGGKNKLEKTDKTETVQPNGGVIIPGSQ